MPRPELRMAALSLLLGAPGAVQGASATVAVAANFLAPVEVLREEFEAASGHELTVVGGGTGQLYTQIVNGAPFDVLLAADRERPRLLVDRDLAERDTRFTYAVGRLVLWTGHPEFVDGLGLETLRGGGFRWLAISNPDLAPYGAAARQTLEALGLWRTLQPRIVRGQNVAQAFAMTETGNAELGLVALSQALAYAGEAAHRIVPAELHEPIRQDAVLLRRGCDNPAAVAFLRFLRSADAAAIIERYGYGERPP